MTKPIVRYNHLDLEAFPVIVGQRAIVTPIDHNSNRVSNNGPAYTSPVISYDKETGQFETLNTIYVLDKKNG